MAKLCLSLKMYAYCFFCQRNRCIQIADYLEKSHFQKAFVPRVINHKREQGVNKEVTEYLLPGYVFAYSEKKVEKLSEIFRIDGVYKLLGEREDGYCLTGKDLIFACGLYDRLGVINNILLVPKGNKYVIKDDLLEGDDSVELLKVDRRKQRAKIGFSFDGNKYVMWIAYKAV